MAMFKDTEFGNERQLQSLNIEINGVASYTLDLGYPIRIRHIQIGNQSSSWTILGYDGTSVRDANSNWRSTQIFLSTNQSSYLYDINQVCRRLVVNQVSGAGRVFVNLFYEILDSQQ